MDSRTSAHDHGADGRAVGIGSTHAEVEQAYGPERDATSSEKPTVFVAGALYGGLVFSFDQGRATGILLGAAAE
jgi:hypothetical protein